MLEIPLKAIEKQKLTITLENSLYELSVKECNGIMAMSIIRDGVLLVENRRVCAGVVIIPPGHLEYGNFIMINPTDVIPYFTQFESATRLVYLTREEVEQINSLRPIEVQYG